MGKKSVIFAAFVCVLLGGCDIEEATQEAKSEQALLVVPESSMELPSDGRAVFAFKIASKPLAPVTVNVTQSPAGVVSMDAPSVVIFPQEWETLRSVTVTCLPSVDGLPHTTTLQFMTSSVDPAGANLSVSRTVVCGGSQVVVPDGPSIQVPTDPDPQLPGQVDDGPVQQDPTSQEDQEEDQGDDTWGMTPAPANAGLVTVTPLDGLLTDETGDGEDIMVILAKRPTSDVYVMARSTDEGEGIPVNDTLIFTPTNWNTPQSFMVRGVDDPLLDGDIDYTIEISFRSGDASYDALEDIHVHATNLDDEKEVVIPDGTPGVLVSPVGGLETTEKGGTAQFDIVLKSEPTADVIIPVISSDPTEGRPRAAQVVFTPENWSQKQAVIIEGIDDDEPDGDVPYTIGLGPVESADGRYDGMSVAGVSIMNADDDPPDVPASFILSTQALTIEESGAPGVVAIRPGVMPMSDVTVSIVSTDLSEGKVSPSELTFTQKDWETAKKFSVSGVADGVADGTQTFEVTFNVTSEDSRFNGYSITPVTVKSTDSDKPSDRSVHLRIMSANISSGNHQAYSPGHGVRIFKAVKPDIVLIQEFNWQTTNESKDSAMQLVTNAFGEDFYAYRGTGSIPNGIISRYPILSSGSWASNIITNRQWDWAVVDLPGPKELLLVSVHLSTDKNAQEMPQLIEKIRKKVESDSKKGQEYFVMIGGDFNTKNRKTTANNMASMFVTGSPYPVDQKGNDNTNANRNSPYDYLLCSPDWCKYEVPVEIGSHTGENGYKHGHVFDSRVYGKTNEIQYVPPVQSNDSGAKNMQHMAVIRDFEYTY